MGSRQINRAGEFFALSVLILGTGLVGCGRGEQSKRVPAQRVVQATTLVAAESEVPLIYEAPGSIAARLNSTLSPKIMGRVLSVKAREGEFVKQGQVLITLDTRELRAASRMASESYTAAVVGEGSAKTGVVIEQKTSQARIAQADSQVAQAKAALAAAIARRDLAIAGPRTQELNQARIAVSQAQSNLKLAQIELDRTRKLVDEGALARRELDIAQNRFDLAKGQYDAALQSESIAREGTRSQELRAAQEAVAQAQAADRQAQQAASQARAAALQVQLRKKDVEVASSQVRQAAAAVESASATLAQGTIVAPFDGRISKRMIDPGAMAQPGMPMMVIQGGEFIFEAPIPERFLKSITLGTIVPVVVDALPGQRLLGEVIEIVPQALEASHSFNVKFTLGGNQAVKSGQFGRVNIRTGSAKGIVIPLASTWNREGLNYVYAVNAKGIARLRIVTLGEMVDGGIIVISGLSPGDRFVSSNTEQVQDGMTIEEK